LQNAALITLNHPSKPLKINKINSGIVKAKVKYGLFYENLFI